MNKIVLPFILFTVLPNTMASQTPVRRILKGKDVGIAKDLEGIYGINLETEKGTVTNSGGHFTIAASVYDI